MLFTVLSWSSIPLCVQLAGGGGSPFWFNLGARLGFCVVCVLFLLLVFGRSLRHPGVVRAVVARLPSRLFLVATLGTFERGFYALSLRFIDVSLAVAVYDLSPVMMVLFLARLYRLDGRYRELSLVLIPAGMLGVLGVMLVGGSEDGKLWSIGGDGLGRLVAGLFIVMVGALANSLTVFGFRWGTELSRDPGFRCVFHVGGGVGAAGNGAAGLGERREGNGGPGQDRRVEEKKAEMGGVVIGFLLVSLVSVVVSGVVAGVGGEPFRLGRLGAAFGGGLLVGAGCLTWRKANLSVRDLGSNLMLYLIPVFSLTWLVVASQVRPVRLDYLALGVVCVVGANLLVNVTAGRKGGAGQSPGGAHHGQE